MAWSKWWLWAWGLVAISLLATAPFVPFRWWVVATAVLFGGMESVGVFGPWPQYPPLTDLIARYCPAPLAFAAMWGFWGGAMSAWMDWPHPLGLSLAVALLGFLDQHFNAKYDQAADESH
jgi:hypothetical protein